MDLVRSTCEASCRALGIELGVAKFDLLISDDAVYVLEVTPRLGGPRFGTEMVPLSNGTNVLRAAIQQAMGEEIDMGLLRPKFERGMASFTIFAADSGRIESIEGLERASSIDGFYDFKWWRAGGYHLGSRVTKNMKLGYYIVSAETRSEVLDRAREAEETIRIVIR
jgi:biotin carboxylase